jgi:U3 small nucleolar RNA-associated protein 3
MEHGSNSESDGKDAFLQGAKHFKKMTGMNSDSDKEQEGEEAGEEGPEKVYDDSIPYLIKKDKGLTAHIKKELRNPRVKNRNRFNKAMVRI